VDLDCSKNREFQIVTGAVWLTKADYFEKISEKNKSGLKGLSEDFVWAFDDCDASLSIKYNLNKKIVYCGQTNIFHEESASLKKNPVNKMFMHHNLSKFRTKWLNIAKPDDMMYMSDKNYNLYLGV
jgi:GT2 family glycosyltransferase